MQASVPGEWAGRLRPDQHTGDTQLLDQAVLMIKETGSFQKELTASELAGIMGSVVQRLTTGQGKIRATVPGVQVRIKEQQGTVAGTIRVEKPITATINVRCTLGNDITRNRLRLVALDVEENAGFAAKIALKAANIRGRAREVLRDPNQAFFNTLGSQLETKGVKLTGIGLNFKDTTLAVDLEGEPILIQAERSRSLSELSLSVPGLGEPGASRPNIDLEETGQTHQVTAPEEPEQPQSPPQFERRTRAEIRADVTRQREGQTGAVTVNAPRTPQSEQQFKRSTRAEVRADIKLHRIGDEGPGLFTSREPGEISSLMHRANIGDDALKIVERRLKGMAFFVTRDIEEVKALDGMNDLEVVHWLKAKAVDDPDRMTPNVLEFLVEWNSGQGYGDLAVRMILESLVANQNNQAGQTQQKHPEESGE